MYDPFDIDGNLADEDQPSPVLEPKPRPTGLTLDEIAADHLDYLHHEAFFVVSSTFEVTAYRTLWFGLQYDSETVEQGETVGNGALAYFEPFSVDVNARLVDWRKHHSAFRPGGRARSRNSGTRPP